MSYSNPNYGQFDPRRNFLVDTNWIESISELSAEARRLGGSLSAPESAVLLSDAGYPSKSYYRGKYRGDSPSPRSIRGMNLEPEVDYLIQRAYNRNSPKKSYGSRFGYGQSSPYGSQSSSFDFPFSGGQSAGAIQSSLYGSRAVPPRSGNFGQSFGGSPQRFGGSPVQTGRAVPQRSRSFERRGPPQRPSSSVPPRSTLSLPLRQSPSSLYRSSAGRVSLPPLPRYPVRPSLRPVSPSKYGAQKTKCFSPNQVAQILERQ